MLIVRAGPREGRMASFNSQEVANTLLAFAKMEHMDVALLAVRAAVQPTAHTPGMPMSAA
jgi:hypothetical protein